MTREASINHLGRGEHLVALSLHNKPDSLWQGMLIVCHLKAGLSLLSRLGDHLLLWAKPKSGLSLPNHGLGGHHQPDPLWSGLSLLSSLEQRHLLVKLKSGLSLL